MIGTMHSSEQVASGLSLAALIAMAFGAVLFAGCTKEEKVLDIETPGGGIEVYEEKPVLE